jgi:DNA-directed RNA polymerase specialized sigma24 family protein
VEKLELQRLLDRLGSDDPEQAWQEFLLACSALILRIVELSEHDPDHAGECFLYCCERLHEHNFRRLRMFRIDGPASFSTWLTAVAGNLCIDWRRQMFGRERVFQSVRRMGVIEQRAFSLIYDRGLERGRNHRPLAGRIPILRRGEVCGSAGAYATRA